MSFEWRYVWSGLANNAPFTKLNNGGGIGFAISIRRWKDALHFSYQHFLHSSQGRASASKRCGLSTIELELGTDGMSDQQG